MSIPASPPPPGLGGVGVEPPGVDPLGVDPLGVEPPGVEAAPVPGAVVGPEGPPLLLIMSAMWSLYTLPSMTFC